jgi:hypothetical protein
VSARAFMATVDRTMPPASVTAPSNARTPPIPGRSTAEVAAGTLVRRYLRRGR